MIYKYKYKLFFLKKNIIFIYFNLIVYYRGCKLDKERFKAIQIHQNYNVPYRGRDKGPISRSVQSNKRKGSIKFMLTQFKIKF